MTSAIYVLVVEDELFSRWRAIDLVEQAGYKAVEASNADEAIAILEARKNIRIVFTDIDMPGSMDGLNSPTPFVSDGLQLSLFSRPGTLISAKTKSLSGGDFLQNHIVITRSFRRYEILLLRDYSRPDRASIWLRSALSATGT